VRRYQYDVAFSYAGEDRPFVEEVASLLRERGVGVFYDRFESVDLWGKNLYTHFQSLFATKARYVVVFISRAYVEKPWPKRELAAALSHPQSRGQPRIWPARFDDTPVPGLSEEIKYEDLQQHSAASFADVLFTKLVQCGVVPPMVKLGPGDEMQSQEEPYAESLVKAILSSCGINPDLPSLPASLKYLPSDASLAQKVLDLAYGYLSPTPRKGVSFVGLEDELLEVAYAVANDWQDQSDAAFYLPVLTTLLGNLSTVILPYLGFPEATKETDPEHMECVTILKLDDPISVREHPLSEAYRDPWMQDWEGIESVHLLPVTSSRAAIVTQLDRSHVEVLGTIWPSMTQHHHTEELMNTLDIRSISLAPEGSQESSYSQSGIKRKHIGCGTVDSSNSVSHAVSLIPLA
jgi:hypothetical protein